MLLSTSNPEQSTIVNFIFVIVFRGGMLMPIGCWMVLSRLDVTQGGDTEALAALIEAMLVSETKRIFKVLESNH